MFEDIGHSSEARSKMKEYLIGTLKVDICCRIMSITGLCVRAFHQSSVFSFQAPSQQISNLLQF